MKLIDSKTKQEIIEGDVRVNLAGRSVTILSWKEPSKELPKGRVYVKHNMEIFCWPSVIGAEFV